MVNKRRIMTIGGTLMCALGIGYFMQMGAPTGASAATSAPPPPAPRVEDGGTAVAQSGFTPLTAPVLPSASAELPAIPAATVPVMPPALVLVETPGADPGPVVPVAFGATASDNAGALADPGAACDITATAETEAGAMVRISVSAPCLPGERVVIHHNGMMFTKITDAQGRVEVSVPALSEMAVFIAEFGSGEGAVAMVEVPSLAFYDRVVLQWAENVSFHVHAREFGAEYGADGHVWAGASRDMSAAALGEGGFLTVLGNPDAFAPRLAEVYTFPTATAAREGNIDLTVETEITAANCGRLIEAQALEIKAEGELRTRDLSLNMPNCDAIGDFLVLNNLMDDLKIAAK